MFNKLVMGLFLLLASNFAHAGIQSQTIDILEKKTDFTESISFNLFNDLNGTLDLLSVEFSLMAQTVGNAKVENESNAEDTITASLSTTISLVDATNNVIASAGDFLSDVVTLGAFDNFLDFGGTSGKTFDPFISNVTSSGIFSVPTNLSGFIGLGNGLIVFSAEAMSIVSGGGNLTSSVNTKASGKATITYTFKDKLDTTVVSTPPQLILLTLALISIFGFKKFRQ